jgi:hypothetical protein
MKYLIYFPEKKKSQTLIFLSFLKVLNEEVQLYTFSRTTILNKHFMILCIFIPNKIIVIQHLND